MKAKATQAKQSGPEEKFGNRGESFVTSKLQDMGFHVTPAGKAASIDAYVMLHDGETNLHFAVQVKTGQSYRRRRGSSKHLWVKLDKRDIVDWQNSSHATIVVWVDASPDTDQSSWAAYWGNASTARGLSIKIRKTSRLNRQAKSKLVRLARVHSGRHGVRVATPPLFPSRVKEIKREAWQFFSEWRRSGSFSPAFQHQIRVTLRSWRHLTRPSRPQREVIHKLSLLPCAREIIEQQNHAEFRRIVRDQQNSHKLYALCGRHETFHRADLAIEVIIELVRMKKRGHQTNKEFKFLSVYEKNSRLSAQKGR